MDMLFSSFKQKKHTLWILAFSLQDSQGILEICLQGALRYLFWPMCNEKISNLLFFSFRTKEVPKAFPNEFWDVEHCQILNARFYHKCHIEVTRKTVENFKCVWGVRTLTQKGYFHISLKWFIIELSVKTHRTL